MKFNKSLLYIAFASVLAFTFSACKSRKLLNKPKPVAAAPQPVDKPVVTPPPPPVKTTPPLAPNYNFSNVQFDFNSAVLSTDAIQLLDHISAEMKKDPSTKFMLNGYASAEGTRKHNMALSVDRANSVKEYLVNAGIDNSRLITQGNGEANPIASNSTESGREKNRRVEVKIIL